MFLCNGYLELPNVYGLIADEKNGVCDCVKLLSEKGHKNVAFLVNHYTPSNRLKQAGFEEGVARYCGNASPVVIETGDTVDDVYRATQRLMRERPETNGIIYAEDLLAVVGLRALSEMGVSVPEDVSVIGINNSAYSLICTPTLTSLDNMLYDLSLTAARDIFDVLKGQRINKKMMIYSRIVERQST